MKYLAFLIVVAAVFVFHSSARAGAYSLEIVAQAGDVIDGRTITGFSGEELHLSINNSGEVAFFADVSSGMFVDLGLMTQNRFIAGAGKVLDGRATFFGSEPHLDMNNRGDVVYRVDFQTGLGRALFVNETLLLENNISVIDGHTLTLINKAAQINDAGTVLFAAQTSQLDGFWTQNELLLRLGQSFEGNTIESCCGLSINNAGEVLFRAKFKELDGQKIFTLTDGIIVGEGDVIDGVIVDKIRSFGLTDAGEVYMNIIGTDLIHERDAFVITTDRIVFGPDSSIRGIPDPILSGDGIVINNTGQLAFWGTVDAPGFNGRFDDTRVFLSAAGEVVVAEGDVLDGKVVRFVSRRFDMNDRGDVVFEVVFEDYSKAVGVATFIPEPSTAALAATGVLFLLAARRKRKGRR
ncbi:MAG: hypothetical protein IID44_24480 [Planctomycetes bacterium]|nr:hypothetical protein [Planctomycetota bacterium]